MYKIGIAYAGILPKNTGQVRIWFWFDDFRQLSPLNLELEVLAACGGIQAIHDIITHLVFTFVFFLPHIILHI
jgi:hypothetical protein